MWTKSRNGWQSLALAAALGWMTEVGLSQDVSPPLTAEQRVALQEGFLRQIDAATGAIDTHPDSVELYSRRGDNYFFAGKFKEALQDYDRMVQLDRSQDASHWRRGIAYFYAGNYVLGADQFTRYHAFDNVDRENGIWRYLCQYRAQGKEAARKELLKYDKDDREPFGDIYRMFSGDLTGEEILQRISAKELPPEERNKQLFYAQLYIGLYEVVEGHPESAIRHLRESAANTWGRQAGYGPHYMWQVGRIQYELLLQKSPEETSTGQSPK